MYLRMPIFLTLILTLIVAAETGTAQTANRTVQPLVPQHGGASLEAAATLVEGIMKATGTMAPGMSGVMTGVGTGLDKGGALLNSVQALNETMENFEPDYSPNGMPRIPLSCAFVAEGEAPSAGEACNQCYADATGQISDVRVDFERLRAVGGRTKAMVDAALAFGDSLAPLAGNGSIGWTQSRPEVVASYEGFKVKYAASYKRLLDRLDKGLRALDTCEREHFDNPDWYSRNGFIFFAFMEGRYELN